MDGQQWPEMGERPVNINEHATVLLDHIANIQKVLNTAKPPVKIIFQTLKEAKLYVERTKKEPSMRKVMGKLNTFEKAAEKHTAQNNTIEDHIIIMKNSKLNTFPTTSKPSWASLVGGAPLSETQSHIQPYNKTHKVIVKLNDMNAAKVLQNQSPKEVTYTIDAQLKAKNITDQSIRVARCLKSGNVAIQMVDDREMEKLKKNKE